MRVRVLLNVWVVVNESPEQFVTVRGIPPRVLDVSVPEVVEVLAPRDDDRPRVFPDESQKPSVLPLRLLRSIGRPRRVLLQLGRHTAQVEFVHARLNVQSFSFGCECSFLFLTLSIPQRKKRVTGWALDRILGAW